MLGDPAALGPPVVAIVGTRDATPYGERIARELAAALARAGACIISGLARGVDACAHRAALDSGGRTAAVLGTGVDVPYPVGHRALHARIAGHGLLLSERPPGSRAIRGCFPRRNRLIAALARLTIVVEAGHTSGALNTARHALELGRDVAAVPGPIDSPTSAGANLLLRDGAHLIASPDDALTLAGLDRAPAAAPAALEGDEHTVWRALGRGALHLDELVAATGLPTAACLTSVTALELKRLLVLELTGEVRRR